MILVDNSIKVNEKKGKAKNKVPEEERQPSLFGKPETQSVLEEFNLNNSSMEVNTAKFGLEPSGDKILESPIINDPKKADTENSTTPTLFIKTTPSQDDQNELEMLLPVNKLNSETSFWSQTEMSSLDDTERKMINARNLNAQNLLNNTVLIPNGKRLGRKKITKQSFKYFVIN